jgi:hypothetical protein
LANTLVFSSAGEAKLLTAALTAENLLLHLYTACATAGGVPSASSIVTDFTEATFTGYASKTLTGSLTGTTWSTPTGSPSVSSYDAASPQSWTLTAGSQEILGYYYVGASTGIYYGAQSFASGITLTTGQATMTLIPSISQGTLPAATS